MRSICKRALRLLSWVLPLRTLLLLLLLSHFSHVRLCVTPETASHQALPSLGFSSQEHWSGLPFPSPMHEGEKWTWSRSESDRTERPHELQPTGLLRPWDFPGQEYWNGVPSVNNTITSLTLIDLFPFFFFLGCYR